MNALATDQARRIADLIHTIPALAGLRAGLYIGASDDAPTVSMTATSVITDKDALHEAPPDMLLTMSSDRFWSSSFRCCLTTSGASGDLVASGSIPHPSRPRSQSSAASSASPTASTSSASGKPCSTGITTKVRSGCRSARAW